MLFGLPDNGAYVKYILRSNDIVMRKEKGEWMLATRKKEAHYGCHFDYMFICIYFRIWYMVIGMWNFQN